MKEFKGHSRITHPDPSTDVAWRDGSCGHCNAKVSFAVISVFYNGEGDIQWLLCPNCAEGSILTSNRIQYPGIVFGEFIKGLPQNIEEAFKEARDCISVNAFTASELICRKLLMLVAHEKGAPDNLSFNKYIDFLETSGYVTPPIKKWVDQIRLNGNESTHELPPADEMRAKNTLTITAQLLKIIYEMDFLAQEHIAIT